MFGLSIYNIAHRLATLKNFSNYPFKDDMISDAIENCLRYMYSYNPEKFDNPLAFFTQIAKQCFLRTIEKEHKHLYTKYKMSMSMNIGVDSFTKSDANEQIQENTVTDNVIIFIEKYEKKQAEKKLKKQNKLKLSIDNTDNL